MTDTTQENTAATTEPAVQQEGAQSTEQQQAPASNQPPEWVTRRLGELAAQRRAAEQRAEQAAAENARLQQQLAQFQSGDGTMPAPVATHPNVEQLARTYAEQMLKEQQQGAKVAEIDSSARKEFGADYDASCQNLQMAGIGGQEFLAALSNVSNPGKLVTWLGKSENLGDASRLMSLNPIQMGIEMERLAGRAAKEMGKQVSKAPPPVEGIENGGSGSSGGGAEPKTGTPEWFEWRNKTARRRR